MDDKLGDPMGLDLFLALLDIAAQDCEHSDEDEYVAPQLTFAFMEEE